MPVPPVTIVAPPRLVPHVNVEPVTVRVAVYVTEPPWQTFWLPEMLEGFVGVAVASNCAVNDDTVSQLFIVARV